jgi:hypothetical protein
MSKYLPKELTNGREVEILEERPDGTMLLDTSNLPDEHIITHNGEKHLLMIEPGSRERTEAIYVHALFDMDDKNISPGYPYTYEEIIEYLDGEKNVPHEAIKAMMDDLTIIAPLF